MSENNHAVLRRILGAVPPLFFALAWAYKGTQFVFDFGFFYGAFAPLAFLAALIAVATEPKAGAGGDTGA